jgi:hypothetical protein
MGPNEINLVVDNKWHTNLAKSRGVTTFVLSGLVSTFCNTKHVKEKIYIRLVKMNLVHGILLG